MPLLPLPPPVAGRLLASSRDLSRNECCGFKSIRPRAADSFSAETTLGASPSRPMAKRRRTSPRQMRRPVCGSGRSMAQTRGCFPEPKALRPPSGYPTANPSPSSRDASCSESIWRVARRRRSATGKLFEAGHGDEKTSRPRCLFENPSSQTNATQMLGFGLFMRRHPSNPKKDDC